jgi:hypothetical protein
MMVENCSTESPSKYDASAAAASSYSSPQAATTKTLNSIAISNGLALRGPLEGKAAGPKSSVSLACVVTGEGSVEDTEQSVQGAVQHGRMVTRMLGVKWAAGAL